ncbi:MAG: serine O-acetyltransferase [Bacteroidota bacterium]
MNRQFLDGLYQAHRSTTHVPSPDRVCAVIAGLLKLLFPELADRRYDNAREFEQHFSEVRLAFYNLLTTLAQQYDINPKELEDTFFEELPTIRNRLLLDAMAISAGDPAAVNQTEVIRTYPGFFAIAVYRIAHCIRNLGIPLIPRILTEHAHSKTGIDIHPGATIGDSFCIDHGTGVVIGETVIIGNQVKIYQGVTLGALSVTKALAETKRHPTIEDQVVIYSGATILGGETTIGHNSTIGGNVWLTKSVPPYSILYYKAEIQYRKVDANNTRVGEKA